jgi:hypothetical protein
MGPTVQGIAILLFALLIFFGILYRLPQDSLTKLFGKENIVVPAIVVLFISVLALHLFSSATETWTADLLKVVAGLLAGVGAGATVGGIRQTIHGDRNVQAVYSRIERIEGDIRELRDSVIETLNQYQEATRGTVVKEESFHAGIPVPDNRFYDEFKKSENERPSSVDAEATRRWFNHRFDLFLSIPSAKEEIMRNVQGIEGAGWHVEEIRFDINPKMADVFFKCVKKISLRQFGEELRLTNGPQADA